MVTGVARGSVIERVAMALRQIECEDAAAAGSRYPYSEEHSWSVISSVLKDGYRDRARRILKSVRLGRDLGPVDCDDDMPR